jgi:hypothetical protein
MALGRDDNRKAVHVKCNTLPRFGEELEQAARA